MIVAMGDLEVISYRPEAGEYAWAFGGAAPVMRLRTFVSSSSILSMVMCGVSSCTLPPVVEQTAKCTQRWSMSTLCCVVVVVECRARIRYRSRHYEPQAEKSAGFANARGQ